MKLIPVASKNKKVVFYKESEIFELVSELLLLITGLQNVMGFSKNSPV